MENFNLSEAVIQLYEKYPELTDRLSDLLNESWAYDARGTLLNELSEFLVNEKYTIHVAELFSALLLELIQRYATDANEGENTHKHELLCVCLAKLIWIYPEAAKFAKLYFEKAVHVLYRLEQEKNAGPPPKKQKVEDRRRIPDEKLLETALQFLMFDTVFFKQTWNWSILVRLLDHQEPRVRWFAYHCLAHVGNIRMSDLNTILQEKFGDEQFSIFMIQDSMLFSHPNYMLHEKITVEENEDTQRKILSTDLSSKVVDVSGVLISKLLQDEEVQVYPKIICVSSVQQALKSLALAVSAGDPILLQGAVGCGKTSLVEHLAEVSGRKPFVNLLKVQLGEHMDSRMLVGCHSCTEIPGEFIWQPGILTQAMMKGHWLLLEDIDCAPMDVISLLAPILKSKTLFLPGHSKPIEVANGFQLFATQRLLRGFDGTYLELQSSADMIEKLWRKVIVNSLLREELEEVICSKWPVLESAIDRILDIYYIFSSDPNSCKPQENGHISCNGVPPSTKPGRLISTRDLFKFCDRISKNFDITSADTGITVFLNALDCFCESIADVEEKLRVAEVIGVKLNLPPTKAAFFLQKYMPVVEPLAESVMIGKICCEKQPTSFQPPASWVKFAHTRQASSLLEKVANAVNNKEPVLLVGETGTGKTSIIQYLASLTNNLLTVINMNQQSDSIDLVGGYKPVDLRFVIGPIRELYEKLFPVTFSKTQNSKFMNHISSCFYHKKWADLCTLMLHTQKNAIHKLSEKSLSNKALGKLQAQWMLLGEKVLQLKLQIQQSENPLAFKFIEGALVKAMKNGEWLLLDEINLAEAETLECLAGVLERDDSSLFLLEKGDKEPIKCHPDFRIFACMNPATDVGKKDLPIGIRNRFTEFFMEELLDKQDLMILVNSYLQKLVLLNQNNIQSIVNFYLYIKKEAVEKLSDGTGHHPHYSLRTLCRALSCAAKNICGSVQRSLYEAFCLSFLSQLDLSSHPFVKKTIINKVLQGKQESLSVEIPEPTKTKCILIEGYWVPAGELEPKVSPNYIITDTVKKNLHDLARIVSSGRYPVLLQGETSVGKTSLVQWLAQATGNQCLRVNNHEHTDIQEYVGTYSANSKGKLVFKEGILVEAMRHGYWIILDELNLAPTDVMEALNRVLDDNRELFIAETQETVKAHPQFMVFATQNPPGTYGGRKILSRAFRNRFIELHFNEIPPSELETILSGRCLLPSSISKRLVSVMQELQVRRRESGVFAGKHGFITLRDLFRWGERYRLTQDNKSTLFDWNQHLANEGYMLLAGRVRRNEEAEIIREAIQKHLKKTVDPKVLFGEETMTLTALKVMKNELMPLKFSNIVWTHNMRRLAVLVGEALKFNEPVLLIGETGCGKTTICQMYAEAFGSNLHTVNCHMHSESADFLGGLRPVRDEHSAKFFEWVDGPLIQAMKRGDFFLTDEISLADDSVLERLNSVLETERSVLLAEKGFENKTMDTVITAVESFKFLATMNPGGDFGKKELSPALRNRFTEIWCPNDLGHADLVSIVKHNIKRTQDLPYVPGARSGYGVAMADFIKYFLSSDVGKRTAVSIRDILTWVDFINATDKREGKLAASDAYMHGAFLVFIDSIGSGLVTASTYEEKRAREDLLKFLLEQVQEIETFEMFLPEYKENAMENYKAKRVENFDGNFFEIGPFAIQIGPLPSEDLHESYVLDAPTPKANAMRILRAMQLPKPILLEGNPGVGKTSLITALARASGYHLMRINLSEQTDISDLFGADLPVEGGAKGKFAWRDGPFVQALKHGHWILLDELNLASQSVLEGLNSCLDHRNEIYVPEIGKTFHLEQYNSRIFGCQNPHKQGGSRKGLPRSFLNRFTQVYLKSLTSNDMEIIAESMFPTIPAEMIEDMVAFNEMIAKEVVMDPLMCHPGYQFDFNLRDVLRWCEAIVNNQEEEDFTPAEYVRLIYADRMKNKEKIYRMCDSVFDCSINVHFRILNLNVFDTGIQLGYSLLPRMSNNRARSQPLCVLHSQLPIIESVMKCLEMKWMPILVGPAASGKSSIVQILASLTGHPIQIMTMNSEMDTTELLGGFEQADLSRHVDSAFQELEPSIEHSICQTMQMGEPETMQHLHNLMYLVDKIKNVSLNHIPSSSAREIKISRQKVKYMLDIIKLIKATPINMDAKSVLSMNEDSLQNLSCLLKSNEEVSTCGKFEWMDSTLVQAVRKGHWLVIDNANFCSPSVLDRLNSLLEPRGVLTITEQGVIGDELLTVVPHPEFRIILIMDPKFGPISRAMRNRGIEIFVEPQNCGKDVMIDKFDLVSVIENQGLTHVQLIKHLLKIHQKLIFSKECDEPSVYELTKAAALIKQLLLKQADPRTALAVGCETVYAENVLNINMRKAVSEIIQTSLSEEAPIRVDFEVLQSSYLSLSPTISEYQQSSVLATLKKLTLLLNYVLRNNIGNYSDKNQPQDFDPTCELLIPHPLTERLTLSADWVLLTIIRITFDLCSIRDWKLFCIWLEHHQHAMAPRLVELLLNYKKMHLDVLLTDPILTSWITNLSEIVADSHYTDVDREEMPIDPKWNPFIYKKLMQCVEKVEECGELEGFAGGTEDKLITTTNRLKIKLFAGSKQFLYADLPGLSKIPVKSLFRISANHAANKVLLKDLPYPWVAKLHPLLSGFYDAFSDLIENTTISDDDYWKMRHALNMFYLFAKDCCGPMPGQLEALCCEVKIFWKWFMKHSGIIFVEKDRFPQDLKQLIVKLTHELVPSDVEVKLRSKMVKEMGAPNAFVDEKIAGIVTDIHSLFQVINLASHLVPSNISKEQSQLIITNAPMWIKTLTDAAVFCLSYDYKSEFYDVLSAVNLVKLQLRDNKLLDSDDDDDIMEVCPTPIENPTLSTEELHIHARLLTLYDFVFVLSEMEIVSNVAALSLKMLDEDNHSEDSLQLELDVTEKFLATVGTNYLGLDPFEMAQLLKLQEANPQDLLAATFVCLSRHLRDGLSANEISCHRWTVGENEEKIKVKVWDPEFLWYKQTPLLTFLFASMMSGKTGFKPKISAPFGEISCKILQIEAAIRLLWTNFDKLSSSTESFRMSAANLIISCFSSLLLLLPGAIGLTLSSELFHPINRPQLIEAMGFSLKALIVSDINILTMAANAIDHLKSEMDKKIENAFNLQWCLGRSFTFVGLLTYVVMLPRDIMDPVSKHKLKFSIVSDQLKEVQTELSLRNWLNEAITGQDHDSAASSVHPYIAGLSNVCQELHSKKSELGKISVYRPPKDQFPTIQMKCNQYVNSFGSPAILLDLIKKMESLRGSVPDAERKLILQKIDNWSRNQRNFADSLINEFPLYRDIVFPFVDGVDKVLMGVQMMARCIASHEIHSKLPSLHTTPAQFSSVEDFLSTFGCFPIGNSRSPMELVRLLIDDPHSCNLDTFTVLLTSVDNEFLARSSFCKLIKSSLLEIINEAVMSRLGTRDFLVQTTMKCLNQFYKSWCIQEEVARVRREERQAQFKHKVLCHQGEVTDEEKLERRLKKYFPSYEELFSDGEEGDDEDASVKKKEPEPEPEAEDPTFYLTKHDKLEVWKMHATLVSMISQTHQNMSDTLTLQNILKDTKSPDFLTPHVLRYDVVSTIINELGVKLDASLDKKLVGAHLFAAHRLLECCHGRDIIEPGSEHASFDIYHNADPSAVLKVHPLLKKLKERVSLLLVEFEEHPSLLKILKTMNQLFKINVSAPLLKFLKGLEIILAAAQEWEENAHKDISLIDELQAITVKVLEWRKLELNSWRESLNSVEKNQFKNCSNWWFHIYGLTVAPAHEEESWDETKQNLLLTSLHEFLECSPLAEFPARLCLVHTFLQTFQIQQSSSLKRKQYAVFFNVFMYYNQFLKEVKENIHLIRVPFEKVIKDFIKVAKWKDTNYYAVKQAVLKSRRTVIKQTSSYKDKLRKQLAKASFVIPSKNEFNDKNYTPWILKINDKDFSLKESLQVTKVKGIDVKKHKSLAQLPRRQKAMKKLIESIVKNFPIINHVNALSEFAGEIVSTLIALNPSEDTGKTETRKKTSLLMQKKKRALLELFRCLQRMGLSYRQGMVHCDTKLDAEAMSVPVLSAPDLKMCENVDPASEVFLFCSKDSNHYFYKSIIQFVALTKALESPSKDLVIGIIHRTRGYSGHLMQMVIEQRQTLALEAKSIDYFSSCIKSLNSLAESGESEENRTVLPPQHSMMKSQAILSNLLVKALTTLEQFKMFLECCPSSAPTGPPEQTMFFKVAPPQSQNASQLSLVTKDSDVWSDIYRKCTQCISSTKELIMVVSQSFDGLARHVTIFESEEGSGLNEYTQSFGTWQNLTSLGSCFKGLQAIASDLMAIVESVGAEGRCFTSGISSLMCLVMEEWRRFKDATGEMREQSDLSGAQQAPFVKAEQQVVSLCSKVVKQVLLAVQNTTRFCTEIAEQDAKEQEEAKDIVSEALLTKKVSENLLELKKSLRMNKIMMLMMKLMRKIRKYQDCSDSIKGLHNGFSLLLNITPLLTQYLQLLKVYLAVNFGKHRNSCKLLSILLNTLHVVITKGYCLPPELQKEALKGETEFKDIEEGGIGEGEGEKDVSKDIKDEQQLEGTQNEEKQANEDENKKIPDEKHGIEMSEDFDAKAFDPDDVNDEEEEEEEGSDKENEEDDLEDKMGNVDDEEAEKIDKKMWGDDSDDEDEDDDLRNDESTSGEAMKKDSELGTKDERREDTEQERGNKLAESKDEVNNEEYDGEHVDPLIDKPREQEAEDMKLPEDMHIEEEGGNAEEEEQFDNEVPEMEEDDNKDDAMDTSAKDSDVEAIDNDDGAEENADDNAGEEEEKDEEGEASDSNTQEQSEMAEDEDTKGEPDSKDEEALPTQSSSLEMQILPSQDLKKKSSHDPVVSEDMEWEGGAKEAEEQHQEGQGEADSSQSKDAGHVGPKPSISTRPRSTPNLQKKMNFKPPSEKRTLEDADTTKAKRRQMAEHETTSKKEAEEEAEVYEHLEDPNMKGVEAVDIATQEQAAIKPIGEIDEEAEEYDYDDDDVIQLDSSSEEEEEQEPPAAEPGQSLRPDVKRFTKSGDENANDDKDPDMEGEIIKTQTVQRGGDESTIHTQHDLWSALFSNRVQERRTKVEMDLWNRVGRDRSLVPDELWRTCEANVMHLAQELCEQLRLVLEPTKMSKLRGDYRTGKRLNMRKIIPYIASQFRKDKIWLRRTKPSKRQYQIMLAMDDSSSMDDNHSKQLAFESLAVMGKSLSLLEAGELAVVSFGERVDLLLGFQEPFTSCTGARIMQQFSFAQKRTNIAQLVSYATDAMVQSRIAPSRLMSKETAQLLVIISDGRGVFNEGDEVVRRAIRRARDNNIFMVFLVMDSPLNKDSILDIRCPVFDSTGLTEMKSYMEQFPFPFYILLRDISSLPLVLGEALRQWFELVTSAER